MGIKVSDNSKQIIDDWKQQLRAYQQGLTASVWRALTILEAEILQNIRSKSGLKVRSGSLLNSIGASKKVETKGDGTVEGTIGPQGIPYAAIHEFGGRTSPHKIEPRNRQALKFMGNNGETFAKFVNHPGSNIPARPYLRPAMENKADFILKEFGLMIKTAFKTE